MKFLKSLIFCFIFLGCQTASAQTIRGQFIVFGDSLSGKVYNWAFLYASAHAKAGDPIGLTVRAYPGNGFFNWNDVPLNNIDCSLFLINNPNWNCTAVIMLGINDLATGNSPMSVLIKLGYFIDKISTEMTAVKRIVIVIEPVNTGPDPFGQATYMERETLGNYIQNLCEAIIPGTVPSISCADLRGVFPEGSPIHPDAAGDQLMADIIGEVLDQ